MKIQPELRHDILNHLAIIKGQTDSILKAINSNTIVSDEENTKKNVERVRKILERVQLIVEELNKTKESV